MADVEYVRSKMVARFGDVAKSIKRTCDLIPLFYTEGIIQRVMTLVLRGRLRTEYLTERRMEEVFMAYECVIKSRDGFMEEDFDRQSELRLYLAASRKVVPNAVSIGELIELGNLLLKCIKDGTSIETESDVEDECSIPSHITSDRKTKESETNSTLSDSDQVHEEPVTRDDPPARKYSEVCCLSNSHLKTKESESNNTLSDSNQVYEEPVTRNDPPASKYSKEVRNKFFKENHIPISTGITDAEIDILRQPTRETRGYIECNPAYLALKLRYSRTTLLNCCRNVCISVLPHQNNLDVEDRSDAVAYYKRLSLDAINRIYAIYKCTSHQGPTFCYPTFGCCLCEGWHFHNHCMKYLNLEMRIKQMTEHNICQQCGHPGCTTVNCHEKGTWTCKHCHLKEDPNHKSSMCNAPERWLKGPTSRDGYRDLYVYANNMATIARATLFWTDKEWIELHENIVDFCLANWKEYHVTAAVLYHAMNPKYRAEMDARGFQATTKFPEWGQDKVFTERPPSRAAFSSSSESCIPRKQLSKTIPKNISAYRLFTGFHSFVLVGVRALLVSKKFSNKLIEEHETTYPLLKVLKDLAVILDRLSKGEVFQMETFQTLLRFEGQSRCVFYDRELDEEENRQDAGLFITELLSYLCYLPNHLSNPSKLFCTTVTKRSQCGCMSASGSTPKIQEETQLTSSFTTTLEVFHELKLTDVIRSLFGSAYPDGECNKCHKKRTAIHILMELADVFVVRINRFKLSNNVLQMVGTKLIIEKEVVLKADTQQTTANLQTILCGDINEAGNGRVKITRTFLVNNNRWYSFEGETVNEVDETLAKEHVQKHGVIFIFRKSERF